MPGKLISMLFATLLLCAALCSCAKSAPEPQGAPALEQPSVSAAPTPSPTPVPEPKSNADINISLLKAPWKAQDFSAIPNCLLYYANEDSPEAFVLLTRSPLPAEVTDTEEEVKLRVKLYIESLKGTGSKITEPEFYEADGMPSASFEVHQPAGDAAVLQKITLVSAPDALYFLQAQEGEEAFESDKKMFDNLFKSLKVTAGED